MFLKFKQTVEINGHLYKLGVHDVPEADLEHPYMEKLINSGFVEASDAPEASKTPQQIHEEKLLANQKLKDSIRESKAAKATEEKAEKSELESFDDDKTHANGEDESQEEHQESKDKAHHSKKHHKPKR
jgi:hypothetical protein